jgi:hypothetical protein
MSDKPELVLLLEMVNENIKQTNTRLDRQDVRFDRLEKNAYNRIEKNEKTLLRHTIYFGAVPVVIGFVMWIFENVPKWIK